MNFNPITASNQILASYLRYMETTFYINDPDVIDFASNLCSDSNFTNDSIIRAKRIKIEPCGYSVDYPVSIYAKLKEFAEKGSENLLYEGIKEYRSDISLSTVNEMLYDLLVTDSRYYRLKKPGVREYKANK